MRSLFLILIYLLHFNVAFSAEFGSRQMGVEFEYAGQNEASDNKNEDTFRLLLEPVREIFGGSEIKVEAWNKYSDAPNTVYASFTDLKGRKWSAVPEIMNTSGYDGYELITPPLNTTDDILKMEMALRKIDEQRLFVPGKSSSSHYTADVSDLIGPNDNVSRIVDLILFLENHTLEIYNLVRPVRYGKAMNNYAIPLSLTQKELLTKLANTPPHERTYKNVRAIFQTYRRKELKVAENEPDHMWKFRLFNYGKFFRLGSFKKRINVIEFRMADLVNSTNFRQLGDIYTTILDVGSREPVNRFIDPFPQFNELGQTQLEHSRMNEFIRSLSKKKYAAFLEKLGLNLNEHPPYKTPHPRSQNPVTCRNIFF